MTGGTKGMGRAIAEAFADDGARVAVLARGAEAIEDTVAELRRRGSPDAVGSIRFVIAHRDPGVPNWLDTAGHQRGTSGAPSACAGSAQT